MRRKRLVIAGAIVILAGLLAGMLSLARSAGAADSLTTGAFDPYLHRTSGQLADPINLVFRGTVDQAAQEIQAVLGWKPVQGSEMVFYDHGSHLDTARQFGLDLGNGSRYHIRLEAVQGTDGDTYVLSGVHRDDSVACGHVGRAFNTARDVVGNAFSVAGFQVTTLRLQNTEPGRQCDGSLTFGDGTAYLIDLSGRPGAVPATAKRHHRLHLPFGIDLPLPAFHF